MDDDHPYLEKKMGHKPYGNVPRLGKIAIWLVLIAIVCGLVLYFAVRTNLIQWGLRRIAPNIIISPRLLAHADEVIV
jgi:hypothetical protein